MVYDFIVIGGGIIGIATARQLQQNYPDSKILLLEKEPAIASHQTGHNSGVIHSGIYYEPGSLKARFCRRGLDETIKFCKTHHIDYNQCGKLLVATNAIELRRMQKLYQRSVENNVNCSLVSAEKLKEMEPWISGLGAILVPTTGIVDFSKICRHMVNEFTARGGQIELGNPVVQLAENESQVSLLTYHGQRQAKMMVCSAGLQADRLVKLHGINTNFQIIPFRGEYYRISSKFNNRFNHLIYPVPDPGLPFLGIHITRMIDGTITVGPNAVLGFKREGYGKLNFSIMDTCTMLGFTGFWRMAGSNLMPGLMELKNSLFKKVYLQRVKKYCPAINLDDLGPYPAGVRAQAVLPDGTLIQDFLFEETKRSLHVCNAPSPAATSAIPIAEYIGEKIRKKFQNI